MIESKRLWFIAMIFGVLFIVGCTAGNDDDAKEKEDEVKEEASGEQEEPTIPDVDDLDPDDPQTEAIQYGEELFNETNTVLPEYSGNELSCQSCHADGGIAQSSSLVGVAADYPQYRPREGVTFTLEDRINGCMVRSMNGKELPYDSEEMRAMMAYFTHLSQGTEIGAERPWVTVNLMEEVPEPDVVEGEELYESKSCISCHGEDGEGTGANSGTALWGEDSFNDGAGMGRLTKMAGYLQNNMPPGDAEDLTDQEAADLAAFLLMQDRPVWEGHDDDFPHGKRPSDIITEDRRAEIQDGDFDWFDIENIVPREE